MTGLIGGRWTAGNRLEPSRPNGRGRIPCDQRPSGVVARPRGGPRQGEGASPPGTGGVVREAAMQGAWATRQEQGSARRGPGRERGAQWRGLLRPARRGWGVPVAESVLAPPGPIPNPVVTQRSAGEYCGGDPTGGEAAAGTPHPQWGRRSGRRETDRRALGGRPGGGQRPPVGPKTQKSGVRIPPPLPHNKKRPSK